MVSIGSILLNKLHGVGFSPEGKQPKEPKEPKQEGKQPKQLKSPWAILSLRVLLIPPYFRGMEHKKYKYKRKRSTVPVSDDLPEADLIGRIKLWRAISGQSVADFGRGAGGDTKLWYELLAGRHLQDSTRNRVFAYLAMQIKAFNATTKFITRGNLNG